jgi:hydrogenase maturation protein HypF
MAKFKQCPSCQSEYDTPTTRRFHAQPNACPACGPRLKLFDHQWQAIIADDPIAAVAARIAAGEVVAIKGLGGFHLVGDAQNAATVSKLRSGKQREEKPFAVMVLNQLSAARYATLSADETALLESRERPIVLLSASESGVAALPDIAPGLTHLGLMLPYTPLHYLLFHQLLGKPLGTAWLQQAASIALVMTSANPGGEPLVKDDAEARAALGGLADAFLTHDRDILHRCDDSVMKWQSHAPAFIRRARGYTPRRIILPFSGPSILACGAWLKNTVCLTRGNEAFVSQHIGDLDHAGARAMLDETVSYLSDILEVQVQAVAHDLHPDFYSTQFAQSYAAHHQLPLIAVQHHQAHIAAITAEHGVTEPVLGLALDGVGLGTDGSAWGGELLQVQGADCQRLGHLSALRLPGGDRAAREPWRMAAAALFEMNRADEIVRRFADQAAAETVATMLQRQLNCPTTTSMGRYFDAAAALLGVSVVQNYEGQAAMQLEALADRYGKIAPLAGGYTIDDNGVLNLLPLLATLAAEKNAARGAALFHHTLAAGLSAWLCRAVQQTGLRTVVLGGGCFLNNILSNALLEYLSTQGLRILTAQQLPPNDGAISLGQVSIALQRINQGI